ncbi:MAG: DUF2855 family protein [Myxococcota bacterium]
MRSFEVRKDDIRETRLVEAPEVPLASGQARLKVDFFSLTSNNVTYAAIGSGPLAYWDFFPAEDPAWGRTPVWGFAEVVASQAEGVEVGRRVYGYFPMSESLDVIPVKVSAGSFIDGAEHRRGKAVIYNQYFFTDADPAYDADFEAEQTLFRPLYATGWLAADCVARSEPPPQNVIISSASSKTAFATAHQAKSRGGITVVGLTSERNLAFVEGTRLYDRVVTYEAAEQLALSGPTVFVDYLGRRPVTAAVHAAVGEHLTRSLVIGVADWEAQTQPRERVPGPKPEMFFAPGYIAERVKADGPAVLAELNSANRAFYPLSREFVVARRESGTAAVERTWGTLVDGKASPADGYVVSFTEA